MRERAGVRGEADLGEAVRPYLRRIAEEGRYPHFARILEWPLDGIENSLVNHG
jgi:hypothetical protein